jgi:hypothetical protein
MNGVFAWVLGLLSFIPGLGHAGPQMWNGYVEDDYDYAAAASAGTIQSIAVKEGQLVHKGDVRFGLEASQQQAQFDAATARALAASYCACCWLVSSTNSTSPLWTSWPSATGMDAMVPALAAAA